MQGSQTLIRNLQCTEMARLVLGPKKKRQHASQKETSEAFCTRDTDNVRCRNPRGGSLISPRMCEEAFTPASGDVADREHPNLQQGRPGGEGSLWVEAEVHEGHADVDVVDRPLLLLPVVPRRGDAVAGEVPPDRGDRVTQGHVVHLERCPGLWASVQDEAR